MQKVNNMVVGKPGLVFGALLCSAFLVACGNDRPANVEGSYTLNITNGNNACNLSNFNRGSGASNVSLVIDQDSHRVTGTVAGLAGSLLTGLLGSNRFEGEVDENRLHMEIVGDRSGSDGNCAYTINATMSGVATGDFLEGTIEYTRVDNGNSDCASLSNCVSVQNFNGSRPPE